MPLQRIDLVAGRPVEQRRAIADAIHRALVEAVGVPAADRFQVVAEHAPGSLVFPPEYLGVSHANVVLVQITLNAGRTLEQKQLLYRRMAELLEQAGSDLVVSLVEVVKENWSFGDGVAQYARWPGRIAVAGVDMAEVVYRSEVTIERVKGPLRRAYLPAEAGPVAFGVHGAVAEHYGRAPGTFEPHATTLDWVVAATAGWLTGTFGGALEARQIPAAEGRLVGRATGEVELEEKVLVIRRIHVRLELRAAAAHREVAERVHGFFASACPLYRTLRSAIAISTELVFVAEG